MTDPKPFDLKAHALLLKELQRESDAAEVEIDRLMGEMASVPPERRDPQLWGTSGTLTRRFVELSERQNELAEQIKLVSQAIEKAAPPKAAD
jgi:hypothetical protein